MKLNTMSLLVGVAAVLFIGTPVFAAPPPVQQIRKEVREERRENLQNGGASLAGVPKRVNAKAALLHATVTGKGTDFLTVTGGDGKIYTVKVDALTQWRRKFWGKSDLAETSLNDVLNIHGKWLNEEMTNLQARLIRNISIQKRNGVFFGTVKSVSATGWVITTAKRGNQTVTVSGSTQFVDRKQTAIGQSSIAVGHRIRVKGLWDSQNNTITEVTQVKDFDLPPKTTPTPKP